MTFMLCFVASIVEIGWKKAGAAISRHVLALFQGLEVSPWSNFQNSRAIHLWKFRLHEADNRVEDSSQNWRANHWRIFFDSCGCSALQLPFLEGLGTLIQANPGCRHRHQVCPNVISHITKSSSSYDQGNMSRHVPTSYLNDNCYSYTFSHHHFSESTCCFLVSLTRTRPSCRRSETKRCLGTRYPAAEGVGVYQEVALSNLASKHIWTFRKTKKKALVSR